MKTKNKNLNLKEIELEFKKLFKLESNFEIAKFIFKAHIGSILILTIVSMILSFITIFFKNMNDKIIFNILASIFLGFSIIFWIINRSINFIIKKRAHIMNKNQRIKELLEEMQNKSTFKFCVKVYDEIIIKKRLFWFIAGVVILGLIFNIIDKIIV